MPKSRLLIVPCPLDEANAFVKRHHRHHGRVAGHKFSLAVADESAEIRGVAIVGRPVARMLDDGLTLEVLRVATDGCPNACSALYGACRRATFALGYRRLVTYTLDAEPGTSLLASGWKVVGEAKGGSWSCPSRPRVDKHPTQGKLRWEAPPDPTRDWAPFGRSPDARETLDVSPCAATPAPTQNHVAGSRGS